MTLRLAVLGNSHLAALKLGWDNIRQDYQDIELTFFAVGARKKLAVAVEDGVLRPMNDEVQAKISRTSQGKHDIDPADYDGFLLCGLYLEVPRLDRRMSSALKKAALDDVARRSVNLQLAALLRRIIEKPLFILPDPLLRSMPSFLDRPHQMENYMDLLEQIGHRLLLPGLMILGQPETTVLPSLLTAEEWSIGSRTPAATYRGTDATLHSPGEYRHMNGDFGAAVLRHHLPAIALVCADATTVEANRGPDLRQSLEQDAIRK